MAEKEIHENHGANGLDQPDPLRSVFTSNLPDVLRQLGISLAISTVAGNR